MSRSLGQALRWKARCAGASAHLRPLLDQPVQACLEVHQVLLPALAAPVHLMPNPAENGAPFVASCERVSIMTKQRHHEQDTRSLPTLLQVEGPLGHKGHTLVGLRLELWQLLGLPLQRPGLQQRRNALPRLGLRLGGRRAGRACSSWCVLCGHPPVRLHFAGKPCQGQSCTKMCLFVI